MANLVSLKFIWVECVIQGSFLHLVMCNLFLMKTLLPFVLKICIWNYVVDFFKKPEAVIWNGVGIQCVTITRHCKLLLIQALRNCFQEGSILLLPSCYQSSAAGNESLSFFRAMTLIEGTAGSFNWIPLGREDIDPTG